MVPMAALVAFVQIGIGLGCISFGLISATGVVARMALGLAGAVVIFYPAFA